ncbi:UbiA family prenyltransferase [Streptomyces sp. WAC 01325]|uniref:UbiA family prenyltransferase n=1 Tax=Streptomyces sp. WAC 01325 TaxID=2203202 RepID=UPI0021B019CB|nr:UbiA family prenyltransferase [Streptomyces sp. WAC 01325]
MRLADLALLVRAPAALSVPGDVIAGAVAAGRPLGARTFGVIGSSVCLYWAGMALNDYADAAVDGVERPDRPVPSGRVPRRAALAVAGGLTAAGLGLAAVAGGRRSVCAALPLAGLVWAYDLKLKSTAAGGFAMAGARMLDVLAGAVVPGSGAQPAGVALRRAAVPAALVGAHTGTLMALSRHEIGGAPVRVPAATLAVSALTALAAAVPVARSDSGGAAQGRLSSAGPSRPVAQFPAPLKGVGAAARLRELCAARSEGLRATASEGFRAAAAERLRAPASERLRAPASERLRARASEGLRAPASEGFRAAAAEGLRASASEGFRAAAAEGLRASASEGFRAAAAEGLRASASEGFRAAAAERLRAPASEGFRAAAAVRLRASASEGLRAAALERLRGAASGRSRIVSAGALPAVVTAGAALAYLGAYGSAQVRAVREPSAGNVRRAVGAGILGLLPLQAALIARGGSPRVAAALGVVHPLARRLARRISPT